MIKMKKQIISLLKKLYINYLLNIQKQKNPLKKDSINQHFIKLSTICKSTIKIFNRKKYRALIALGILKTSTKINKNDYYINVFLTRFGVIICKELLFKLKPLDEHYFKEALVSNPTGIITNPLLDFWNGVDLNDNIDSNVVFRFTSFDNFETWLLKYPNIKKIVPFINNRTKTEETIRAIYNYVYIKPMDYSSMNEDDDILFL